MAISGVNGGFTKGKGWLRGLLGGPRFRNPGAGGAAPAAEFERRIENLAGTAARLEREKRRLEDRLSQRECEYRDLKDEVIRLGKEKFHLEQGLSYAKRIQQGMLARRQELAGFLSRSFVLDIPRDEVGGDFFWCRQSGERVMLVVADCTGHGVPGAFMTVLGNALFDRYAGEERWDDPGAILREVDGGISELLIRHNPGTEIYDGMDAALVVFHRRTRELCYCGAKRPLVVVSGGEAEVLEPTRASLGGHWRKGRKAFPVHRRRLKKGDVFYAFTDGFPDQFGGDGGRKLGTTRLVASLSWLGVLEQDEQEKTLRKLFHDWRGERQQMDDLLLVGVGV